MLGYNVTSLLETISHKLQFRTTSYGP